MDCPVTARPGHSITMYSVLPLPDGTLLCTVALVPNQHSVPSINQMLMSHLPPSIYSQVSSSSIIHQHTPPMHHQISISQPVISSRYHPSESTASAPIPVKFQDLGLCPLVHPVPHINSPSQKIGSEFSSVPYQFVHAIKPVKCGKLCSQCGATETTEWRHGYEKSLLCNACGLRHNREMKRLRKEAEEFDSRKRVRTDSESSESDETSNTDVPQ